MKKAFVAMISIAFLLAPVIVYPEQTGPNAPPPISQQLVPEGDFALRLVPALKLGTPDTEAQAEDTLTSVGIAPKNGWIADYPVTPDIIGELEETLAAAADSKKVPMGKDEALKAFQDLTTEFGLAVVPGGSSQYAEKQPQLDPTIINDYYYEEGPPVVTYYPPPWDYYYLYAWVPYPFWWNGFFFSGFFCLHDFHRIVHAGHHRFVVSNHVFNHASNTVARVDPVSRTTGNGFRTGDISHSRSFNSTEARRGATSIVEHSHGQGFSRGDNRTWTFAGRGETETGFRSMTGRTTTQPRNAERNAREPSTPETRGFNGPGRSFERSFSTPSTGGRNFGSSENSVRAFSGSSRSFSGPSSGGGYSTCASCHGGSASLGHSGGGGNSRGFSAGHSSGGSSGGSSSRGFSGGGFSGGHGGGGKGR